MFLLEAFKAFNHLFTNQTEHCTLDSTIYGLDLFTGTQFVLWTFCGKKTLRSSNQIHRNDWLFPFRHPYLSQKNVPIYQGLPYPKPNA